MKKSILCILILFFCVSCVNSAKINNQIMPKESVLKTGMKLCATCDNETICIYAEDDFKRIISWDGASRQMNMVARSERWHGAMGLVSPESPDDHIEIHKGITRILYEEAQINMQDLKPFYKSIHNPYNYPPYNLNHVYEVYRDDGLWISWTKSIKPKNYSGTHDGVLDITISQILINGKKPTRLEGSRNDQIITRIMQE